MRLTSLTLDPFHSMEFDNVSAGRRVVTETLRFYSGTVDRLPEGLGALVATADLQGLPPRERFRDVPIALGESLAEELVSLSESGKLPAPERIGILLAGDFYARPKLDRRGGSGDVRPVWRAFARMFRWVTGVAGNHDRFGDDHGALQPDLFQDHPRIHLLDDRLVDLDGMRVAGLSGIVGNPRRPFRREEKEYVDRLLGLLEGQPDVVILHDGPSGTEKDQLGLNSVGEALRLARPTLVIRGHAYWPNPVATLDINGSQVLNVDGRVVILSEDSRE